MSDVSVERVKPYDLADACTLASPEVAALSVLANNGYCRDAIERARDLPSSEEALVCLAVGDVALLGGDAQMAVSAYERAQYCALLDVRDVYRRVEAAAFYGLALVAIAERNAWDAALRLKLALKAIDDSFVPKEHRAAKAKIRFLQEEVLSGVAMNQLAASLTPGTVNMR